MAAGVLRGGLTEREEGGRDGKQRDGWMEAALVFSDERTLDGNMFTGCDCAASAGGKTSWVLAGAASLIFFFFPFLFFSPCLT